MKIRQFVQWLQSQGVQVSNASRHYRLEHNGLVSFLPRHPGKELAKGTAHAVRKQLGL